MKVSIPSHLVKKTVPKTTEVENIRPLEDYDNQVLITCICETTYMFDTKQGVSNDDCVCPNCGANDPISYRTHSGGCFNSGYIKMLL